MTKEGKASLPLCLLESPLVDKDVCGRFYPCGVSNLNTNFGPGWFQVSAGVAWWVSVLSGNPLGDSLCG